MAKYDEKLIDTSEVFKALSHPARLCIVNKLKAGDLSVGQMRECLDASQSNISQHLSILKNKKIIYGERVGSEVIYSLVDERMIRLIDIFLNS